MERLTKIANRILILLISTLSIFSLSFTLAANLNNPTNNNVAVSTRSASISTFATEEGETPEELFTIPVLPDQVSNLSSTQPRQLWDGFDNTTNIAGDSMRGPQIESIYSEKVAAIVVYTIIQTDIFKGPAEQAELTFTNASEVFKNYQLLNGLGNVGTDKTLKITRPTQATDIFNNGDSVSSANSNVTIPTDFKYKVGEVDLGSLAENAEIVMTYKNTAAPGADDQEYNLVISNRDGILNAAVTDDLPMQDLIEQNLIYVRDEDDGNAYDFNAGNVPTPQDFSNLSDELFIQRDEGKLNIMVQPSNANDAIAPIEIGVSEIHSTEGALGALSYGILDDSLSPLHIKPISNFTDTEWLHYGDPVDTPLYDPTSVNSVHSLPLFKYYSNWKQQQNFPVTGGAMQGDNEHIRFFMSRGTEFSSNIYFDNMGSEVFDGQNNEFTISYDNAGLVEVIPQNSRFQIKQVNYDAVVGKKGVVSPISVSTNELVRQVGATDVTWLQVDIVLQKGVIQLNPSPVNDQQEADHKFRRVSENMFFEIPKGFENLVVDPKSGVGQIRIDVEAVTAVTEQYKEILGNLYANWGATSGIDETNPYDYISPNFSRYPEYGYTDIPVKHGGYYEDDDGSLIAKRTYDDLLLENDKGKPELDENGEEILIGNIGTNLVPFLNDFTNRITDWSLTKLGATEAQTRGFDFYKLTDKSNSIGFVEKNIIQATGAEGIALKDNADAITRYWTGQPLTVEQVKFLDEYKSNFVNPDIIDIDAVVKDKAKTVAGIAPDTTTQEYAESIQAVYYFISPYMAAAINNLFVIEQQIFDSLKGGILGRYMNEYLSSAIRDENGNDVGIGVNPEVLFKIDPEQLDAQLSDVHLIAVNEEPTTWVPDGAGALGSLVDFIYNFNLQGRYLNEADSDMFLRYYESGSFTNGAIFNDENQINQIKDMVGVLDSVLKNILGESAHTLEDIIDDIIALKGGDPVVQIRAAVQQSIEDITDQTQRFSYEFFGNVNTSSYLENLVMGYNISQVIQRYIEIHDEELLDSEREVLLEHAGQGAYQTTAITQLGINMGYYNFEYFIYRLLNKEEIPGIALEILESDLGENLTIEIPETSRMVDLISDSDTVFRWTSTVAGGIMATIGMFSLGMTFRKASKQGGRKIGTARLFFGMIIGLGFIITLSSQIIPILLG